jgi:hypothetical protein
MPEATNMGHTDPAANLVVDGLDIETEDTQIGSERSKLGAQ